MLIWRIGKMKCKYRIVSDAKYGQFGKLYGGIFLKTDTTDKGRSEIFIIYLKGIKFCGY